MRRITVTACTLTFLAVFLITWTSYDWLAEGEAFRRRGRRRRRTVTGYGDSVSLCVPCSKSDLSRLPPFLRSLRSQTVRAEEIVIVVPTSTELKRSVRRLPGHPKVVVVEHDAGSAWSARHRAAEVATGDILSFLNVRDRPHRQRTEIVRKVLSRGGCDALLHPYGWKGKQRMVDASTVSTRDASGIVQRVASKAPADHGSVRLSCVSVRREVYHRAVEEAPRDVFALADALCGLSVRIVELPLTRVVK